MARADSILRRINRVMANLQVTDRQVFKRTVMSVGGDPLTGRGVSYSDQELLLDPQPVIEHVSVDFVRHGHTQVVGNTVVEMGDYLCTVSTTAINTEELTSKDTAFVFRGASNEELRMVVSYAPLVINGRAVAFQVLLRSKKRMSA